MKNFALFAMMVGSCTLFAATGTTQNVIDEGMPNIVATSNGCKFIAGQDNVLQVLCNAQDGQSLDAHTILFKDGKYVDSVSGKEVTIPDTLHVSHDDTGRVSIQK